MNYYYPSSTIIYPFKQSIAILVSGLQIDTYTQIHIKSRTMSAILILVTNKMKGVITQQQVHL